MFLEKRKYNLNINHAKIHIYKFFRFERQLNEKDCIYNIKIQKQYKNKEINEIYGY